MHRDKSNGTWPELKAKRHDRFDSPKFDDAPMESLSVAHRDLDEEMHDSQKLQRDRAAKQLFRVQNMFKEMADYDETHNKRT